MICKQEPRQETDDNSLNAWMMGRPRPRVCFLLWWIPGDSWLEHQTSPQKYMCSSTVIRVRVLTSKCLDTKKALRMRHDDRRITCHSSSKQRTGHRRGPIVLYWSLGGPEGRTCCVWCQNMSHGGRCFSASHHFDCWSELCLPCANSLENRGKPF
jgi:hypothetical protein